QLVQAGHTLDQVVVAEGIGHPDVAGGAERLARHPRHLALLEPHLAELRAAGRPPAAQLAAEGSLDRRVDVERAERLRAPDAPDGAQNLQPRLPGPGRAL